MIEQHNTNYSLANIQGVYQKSASWNSQYLSLNQRYYFFVSYIAKMENHDSSEWTVTRNTYPKMLYDDSFAKPLKTKLKEAYIDNLNNCNFVFLKLYHLMGYFW